MFFLIVFVVIPFNLLEDYSISCEYCEVQVHMINCFDLTHFKLDVCKRLFIISPFILLCFIDFLFSRTLKTQKKVIPTSPSPINNTNNSSSQQTTTSNPLPSLTTTPRHKPTPRTRTTWSPNPRSKPSSQRSIIPILLPKNFKQILEKKVNH